MQAALAQPVVSSVPTLVVSGALDPITPSRYADIAAESLSDALVVTYANSGHGASVQTECGRQHMLAFLANPDTSMDVSCAPTLTTNYVLPAGVAPSIPTEAIGLEMLETVPPEIIMALRNAQAK